MKIIQSCWSCNRSNLLEFNAGWYSSEYNLMSWALSCLQLNKYYGHLTLYADSASARSLIDDLQLPYTTVHCELDQLNNYNSGLWALPKIYAYSKQEEAFLHVDADAYIWEPFDKCLLSEGLIAQNIEILTDYNDNIMLSLEKYLKYFPNEIFVDRQSNNKIYTYNAGVMGGSDMLFFKEFTRKAFDFVNNNVSSFNQINVSEFNVFYEQYLFYCIAKRDNKRVSLLLNEIRGGSEYFELGDFLDVPYEKKFLHLLGLFKINKIVCELLADRLRLDYPEYYYRIIALFKANRLPLRRDYYFFCEGSTSFELVAKHELLKGKFNKNLVYPNQANTISRKFEVNKWRRNLVKWFIEKKFGSYKDFNLRKSGHLVDVTKFENRIVIIGRKRFLKYSNNYLYARDIAHTEYFQIIFGNKAGGFDISIITDPIYEILISQYDWSEIDWGVRGEIALKEQLNLPPSTIYTAIIPECDSTGYSLTNVDELDIAILNEFRFATTINELLVRMVKNFDLFDIESALEEYDELIVGRVKMAMARKLIKVVQC